MFITVSGQKGGVAKTCTSIHLASVWADCGRSVCVVDADRNRSALAYRIRGELPFQVVPVEAVELIHPNEVLSALKTFVTLNQKSDGKKKLAKFSLSALNDRNDANDAEYWGLYENLIDEKKNKLWDAMLSSLQKYQ